MLRNIAHGLIMVLILATFSIIFYWLVVLKTWIIGFLTGTDFYVYNWSLFDGRVSNSVSRMAVFAVIAVLTFVWGGLAYASERW